MLLIKRTTWGNSQNFVTLLPGLENIYFLTQQKQQELVVDMEDFEGNKVYARYTSFSVGPESDGYRLQVGDYIDGGAGGFQNQL